MGQVARTPGTPVPVVCMDENNNYDVYDSMRAAAEGNGKNASQILKAIRGGRKCGGKRWREKVVEDPPPPRVYRMAGDDGIEEKAMTALVLCETTGERFGTLRSLRRAFPAQPGDIEAMVRNRRGTLLGASFRVVEIPYEELDKWLCGYAEGTVA